MVVLILCWSRDELVTHPGSKPTLAPKTAGMGSRTLRPRVQAVMENGYMNGR